jgi:hypothetical protein
MHNVSTMSPTLILFITIQLAALVYLVELLRRIYVRSKEYELKEEHSTLPFGFIRLRHVVFLYVVSYLFWVVGSLCLYHYFVDPTLFGSSQSVPSFKLTY